MTGMATSAACLDDNRAAEFATGSLSTADSASVETHLARCRDCRALVRMLAVAPSDSQLVTQPREHGAASRPTVPAVAGERTTEYTVGDRIGRYVVLGRLGQGGMGVVLSAYDPQLDRKVAIKVLRTGIGLAAGEARARMIREAKAIAQLSHPNVVAVYDVGTAEPDRADGGDVYIAMEFVEGDTLTTWKRRWHRPWREVIEVFLQAGRGLVAAHGAGLLHRDFKPDNVLVGADGRVRVGDFGLARSALGPDEGAGPPVTVSAALAGSLTATGTVVGTPRYMSPETLRGVPSDARSDQFSYCVALYEALFDQHPFEGETAVSMIEKDAVAAPPPEGHRVPTGIVRAVMRGLNDVPSKRFGSMATLIGELAPPPIRAPRRVFFAAGAAALAIGVATAAVLARGGENGVAPDERQEFVAKIDVLERERTELLDRIKDLEGASLREIAELRDKIKQKDTEIQTLLEKVEIQAELQFPPERVTSIKPVAPTADAKTTPVLDALRSANLGGCFDEWSKRRPDTDVRVRVTMKVSPTGLRHDATASGVDDASLGYCVSDGLTRIQVPAPGSALKLAVDVSYTGGLIAIAPRLEAVEPAAPAIDGDDDAPEPASTKGLIDL
jgi:eukaryotic-like serine/threonine-protein kinase